MSGWVSFDEEKDTFSSPVGTSSKSSEPLARSTQAWVKFEGSPASSTPIARGRVDIPRAVVPQHTGGSAYSGADVQSQASDDHHSVVASSLISSRDSFSSSHDISSSREYMPLESSSPNPTPGTPSSEGWARLGESKRIASSTPKKAVSPDRVISQNGYSETSRVSSPAPANWVQFDFDKKRDTSTVSSRLSLVSSQNNSHSLESPVADAHMLDKVSSLKVTEQKQQNLVNERQGIVTQREPVHIESVENTDGRISRATPLHMTDHAHDMEVSMFSEVRATSESKYATCTSPGNPFKDEIQTLKQLEKQKIMEEEASRTVSPYNPFMNVQPAPVQNVLKKTNNSNAKWTTFDETDGNSASQSVHSPGNPFADMSSTSYVQQRTDSGQPNAGKHFPKGNVIVPTSTVTPQTVAMPQSLRQVAAVQPPAQPPTVQVSEQTTSALLSSGWASPPTSPFSVKPNQWPQQQYIPTSPKNAYQQSAANVAAQDTTLQKVADKSKEKVTIGASIKSRTSTSSNEKGTTFEDEYPREQVDLSDGWPLKLRCPDKKKIAGSRYWKLIHVRLAEGNILQLFEDSTRHEPFREIPLQCNYEVGLSHLQQFNAKGKVHTIKLLYTSYKEKRKMGGKLHYDKEMHRQELLKLGSLDFKVFTSFVYTINDALMKLTLYHDKGAHYNQDMISVIVSDECRCLVNAAGEVVKQSISTNVNILGFLSGSPDCAIGLNDVQVKGLNVVERQHIIPNKTSDWIKLHNVELHKCANKNVFADSRMIEFQPLNACQFRLMQFHVQPSAEHSVPLEIRAVLSGEGTYIELRVDLLVPACTGRRNPTHYMCENVRVYIPVPDKWISYFRRPKRMGQSSIHGVHKKAEAIKRGCLMPKLLEISVGSAKYEHAFGGVVWRIDRLPERATGIKSIILFDMDVHKVMQTTQCNDKQMKNRN